MQMAKLGYQNSKTPEPTDTNFSADDYISNIIPHAKIQRDHPISTLFDS